jgi:glycosyltransferase involved in cell wall biosynthesis
MIKVGFITSPLSSGHAPRGVGFYTKNLLSELTSQASHFNLEIIEVNNPSKINNSKLKIVHYPYFDLFTHTLPIFPHIPSVVTVHDVIPLEFPQVFRPGLRGHFNLMLQKAALNQTQAVITVSYASVKAIHALMGVPHSKIKLIYNAASSAFKPISDKALLNTISRKYHLPSRFVLYVGDVNWNKNLPGLVSACQHLKVPLVVVGKHAAEIPTLNLDHPELSHLKNLGPFTALGFVSEVDLVGIYNLATVYCQPSFAEGFGIPILEAMSCGTPVVCSRTHSLPEIAQDAACYFNPAQTSELIISLDQVLHSPKQRQLLSHKGLVQAQKFTWRETALQTLSVYSHVVASSL